MNAESWINSTHRGITIDRNDDDNEENACDSIRFNDDGDSNEIDESNLQSLKHDDLGISIEHGIKIDLRFESENACPSIRFNDDGDSNEIDESDLHFEKHDEQKIST
jgi:hypothetical protein